MRRLAPQKHLWVSGSALYFLFSVAKLGNIYTVYAPYIIHFGFPVICRTEISQSAEHPPYTYVNLSFVLHLLSQSPSSVSPRPHRRHPPPRRRAHPLGS